MWALARWLVRWDNNDYLVRRDASARGSGVDSRPTGTG